MQRALWTTFMVGGPIVLVSMVVGLTISIFQAATQINEATLTFVPKLVLVALVLVILGPSMIDQLVQFTQYVFQVASQASR
jgi:flagellar biosynthetic protein FliQ